MSDRHKIVMFGEDAPHINGDVVLGSLDLVKRADVVIDSDGTVIKDRYGIEKRPATDEEIDAAFLIGRAS